MEHTVRADIIPGGTFPDYELTDHTKARRRLSELQETGDHSMHHPYQQADHVQTVTPLSVQKN